MICAYDKVYLDKARTALGRMLDFAVYDLHYELASFFELFIESGVSSRFENGDYRLLVGMSGVPLRTIQQYEQRQKSINRAQAEYLAMLAKALYCEMEDLLEKTARVP